jgi:hypothetical protein
MAAVDTTTKALETVTVSKTKELKGASTPRDPSPSLSTINLQLLTMRNHRQRKETLS